MEKSKVTEITTYKGGHSYVQNTKNQNRPSHIEIVEAAGYFSIIQRNARRIYGTYDEQTVKIERFAKGNVYVAYLGLTPGERSGSDKVTLGVTKEGNRASEAYSD